MPRRLAHARSTRNSASSPYARVTGKSSSRQPVTTPASLRAAITGAAKRVRSSADNRPEASKSTRKPGEEGEEEEEEAARATVVFSNTPAPARQRASAKSGVSRPTLTPATRRGTYVAMSSGVISLHSATRARKPGMKVVPPEGSGADGEAVTVEGEGGGGGARRVGGRGSAGAARARASRPSVVARRRRAGRGRGRARREDRRRHRADARERVEGSGWACERRARRRGVVSEYARARGGPPGTVFRDWMRCVLIRLVQNQPTPDLGSRRSSLVARVLRVGRGARASRPPRAPYAPARLPAATSGRSRSPSPPPPNAPPRLDVRARRVLGPGPRRRAAPPAAFRRPGALGSSRRPPGRAPRAVRRLRAAAAAEAVETASIGDTFADLKARGQCAFVPFICAGDPNLGATAKALKILDDAGADVIELGVPYSDPSRTDPPSRCARHDHPDGTRPDPTRRGPRPRPPGDDERPRPSRPATARGSIDREPTLSEAAAVVRRARGGPVFFIARFGNRVGKRIPLAKKGFLLVGRRPRRFDRPLPLIPLRRRSSPPIARARRLATPDPERR